jgi:hypothetical protein
MLIAAAAGPLSGCATAAKSALVDVLGDPTQVLAAGGVAVMDDVRSTRPIVPVTGTPSAMRFTRWQVRNMVAEANAHTGYLGSELDTLAQPPPGSPGLSTLIGAWLTRKEGALAQYAAGVMGPHDYKQSATLIFPTIVVLTFIGDIARVSATSQLPRPRFDPERFFASPAEAAGECTDIAGWVSSVVNSVTAAVQANGSGWLASLWNMAVSVAGTAITVLFNSVAQPLLTFITSIATICGTLMQVSSMFKPWSVQLAGSPSTIKLGDVAQDGQFVATLHAADIPWPSTLVDCVKTLSGVDLDDASYKDAPVTWTPIANIPGLATETSDDTTLLANKTAAFHFQTTTVASVDPNDCPRTVPAGNIAVRVSVARTDITKTLESLESLITNQINASVRAFLSPYIDTALGKANNAAAKFAAPHETGIIALTEDIADPLCSHTPPPNTTPTTQPSSAAAHGTLPNLPCEAVATASDTSPYLNGGVVFEPVDEQGRKIEVGKMMGQLIAGTALDPPAGAAPFAPLAKVPAGSDYDSTKSSWCTIGKAPDTIVALFAVLPKGALPYHQIPDLRADDAQSPRPCRAVIGITLLDVFDADCRSVGGVSPSVTLYGPTVEYIILAAPGDFDASPTALASVLAHIAQRSH